MDAVKIVNKINKEHGTIKNVYFLACGGSLVDLYPGYYFVRAESAVMDAQWIPAREFALTPPKKLGKDSLLLICSHSGKTKECLEAAKVGMNAGAAVVTMTHAPGSACDTDEWISVVYDWAPGVKEAEKPQEEKTARVRLNDKRKMSFKEKREFEQLEKEIAQLEAEKAQIEELLCSGTLSVDELTDKSKRLPEVNELIDEKTMRWLELSEIEG